MVGDDVTKTSKQSRHFIIDLGSTILRRFLAPAQ
jgi:hypothetical protein